MSERPVQLVRAKIGLAGTLLSIGTLLVGACSPGDELGAPLPATPTSSTASSESSSAAPTTTTTSASATSRPVTTTTTKTATPAPQPVSGGRSCPPVPAYPTKACTGVPAGLSIQTVNGDLYAKTPGQVIDGQHVTGNLVVLADNVVIRNTQIDGFVTNTSGQHSYTITDSTVGVDGKCDLETGVGEANFTATRVYVRGHGDGFGDAGNNILIQDSYVHLCGVENAHSDGVQGYLGGYNVVVKHNTIDQRDVPQSGQTAPVFFSDGSKDATIVDNLLMGGSQTIRVNNGGGTYIVTGNRVVDHAWIYGAVNSDCAAIKTWSDNRLVTIDSNYNITSVGSVIPCSVG